MMITRRIKGAVSIAADRLECPIDEDANYHNSYWCNRDLIPMPADRRTWTWQGYAGYWVIAGINTTPWTIGSSLLALGLSVGQAMGVVVATAIIIGLLAVLSGWPGSHQHIGFTVLQRSSWGMRGAFFPVLNRVLTGCIWMGIQMYWGGQAVRIILGAIIGRPFVFMKNTLPATANVTTPDIISFFIFVVIFAPLLLIRPERLQLPFRITFIMITTVLVGMLIWSLSAARGAGDLLHSSTTIHGSRLGWNAMYGMMSFIGGYGSGTMGQSDWTRYSKTPRGALFGQAVTAPLTIIITSFFGILITSATANLYGTQFWSPFELLLHAQQSLTPAARAGTFFAGLGLLASQAACCIVLNSVAAGMDLTTLWPKYINMRRGSIIITFVGIAVVPWNFVNKASTFITVLSGWSVFLAPMTGILFADYYFVRHRQLHLADLYVGNSTSAYWYTYGFNWRTIIAWAMALWPILPGFVRQVRGENDYSGWDIIYDMNYLLGFPISFIIHLVLHWIFPTAGEKGVSGFRSTSQGILAFDKHNFDGAISGSIGDASERAGSETEEGVVEGVIRHEVKFSKEMV